MRKIIFIIVILMAAAGVGGFWYYQRNIYSKEILKIEILGPEFVQAGDEIEYLVKYKNNGKFVLENVNLRFEFPFGSIPQDSTELRITKEVDDIYPGEEKNTKFKGRIFGKENDNLAASAFLTYKVKNLKATYESKTTFTTQIKFVPLTFEFDLPLKIESNSDFQFSLNYFSNINYSLENLRIKIEYPDGFEFKKSSPSALDKSEWEIPLLKQNLGGRLKIWGAISGEIGQQKIFKARLGLYKNGDFIVLKETAQSVQIAESSIYLSQLVNNSEKYNANLSDLLHYEIFFKNIGKHPFEKQFLIIELNSELFDFETLRTDQGEIGAGDNTIFFDWKKVPELRFLDTNEEGKVDFWIKLKRETVLEAREITNPVLRNKIRLGELLKEYEIKVNSKIAILQKGYFQDEIFGNIGPMPPEVSKPTTFTVIWQIENSFNPLTNGKVKAKLADNVKATGKFFPNDASFSYDPESKEVIWIIKDIDSYQHKKSPLSLAFQIELIPIEEQSGKIAKLVNEAEFIAQDNFTSEILSAKSSDLTTLLPDDETVSKQEGRVHPVK